MNNAHKFPALIVAAVAAMTAHAGDDAVKVTTLRQATGHTVCNNDSFGYPLSEPAIIVRGDAHHKVRIERNLVDVGLERASFSSCGPDCAASVTSKGNFDSGGRGHLIDRKGFAELDIHLPASTPTGNATLVLHYFGGGRGEYKLLVVRNSRVDRVESVNVSNTTDRVTLRGNNLDRLTNRFIGFTRIRESDAELVLAPEHRSCSAHTETIDLTLEASRFCHINDVKIPLTRDASCAVAGNVPPPAPPQPAPPAAPPVQAAPPPVRLNLTPGFIQPIPFFRSQNPLLPDAGALRRRIDQSFCATFANDEERLINLLPIRWGINYAGLPSPSPVSADVLDGNGNLLQRRTADPITQGNGSDSRFFDNWTSRPASVKVVFAFSEKKRDAIGARPISGGAPSPAGCYLAPSEPLGKFDPQRLIFRVNTSAPAAAETQTNDNEITL